VAPGITSIREVDFEVVYVLCMNEELSVVDLGPANKIATVLLPAICMVYELRSNTSEIHDALVPDFVQRFVESNSFLVRSLPDELKETTVRYIVNTLPTSLTYFIECHNTNAFVS
jgi:hypothetical protein